MKQSTNVLITGLAPILWGSSYFVVTELLPLNYPITISMLRALPVGLVLLLMVRKLPTGIWWLKVIVLGALNFSVFWVLLLISAYKLPGGVTATIAATQPIIVIVLSKIFMGTTVRKTSIIVALAGTIGVAILVLSPEHSLPIVGVFAAATGAISMALGTVLTRKWQPNVSLLVFTSWQLVAGGILLLPVAMYFEPALPSLTGKNLIGLFYLGPIATGISYYIWFRGLVKIEPSIVSSLIFLSPISAVIIGWLLLEQNLSFFQLIGSGMIFLSLWFTQFINKPGYSFKLSLFENLKLKNK